MLDGHSIINVLEDEHIQNIIDMSIKNSRETYVYKITYNHFSTLVLINLKIIFILPFLV